MKRVAIRTDSSNAIGTGHVIRCLTLAKALKARGSEVAFVCRAHPGNLIEFLTRCGFEVVTLPEPKAREDYQDPQAPDSYLDWLGVTPDQDAQETFEGLSKISRNWDLTVVDHYALGRDWELSARKWSQKLMVVDDLANREHVADLLLDQNVFENPRERYRAFVQHTTQLLVGPRYAPVRSEILSALITAKKTPKKDVVVYYGGNDLSGETLKALHAFQEFNLFNRFEGKLKLVVGMNSVHFSALQKSAQGHSRVEVLVSPVDLGRCFSSALMSLGASGCTTWERCLLGVPSLVTTIADNQVEVAASLAKTGAIELAGKHFETSAQTLGRKIQTLLDQPQRLKSMAQISQKLVDGEGTQRVVDAIAEAFHGVRS